MDRTARRRVATIVASFLFGFYICWNVWWLLLHRVPPALMLAVTGIPAPTTGGTRSLFALASGEIGLSLYHNVATIPIIALLLVTLAFAAIQGTAPKWIGHLWCQLLSLAFLAKIVTTFAISR